MAFRIQAECDSCDYSVKSINIGDGKHLVFICGNCRRLVNPKRIPYRLDCPECPRCRRTLERSGLLESGQMPSRWIGHPPVISDVACPRCDSGKLLFARTTHRLIRPDLRPPKVGQRVHARFDENCRLNAVGVYQQITLQEPVPGSDQSLVLDCEVVSADSKHVVLQCVDTLPFADVPGYS
jgi:hypothetical protein